MAGTTDGTVLIENADLIFRNFAGQERQFNTEGQRNFCVKLDPDLANQLRADGWNVKQLKPLDEGDSPQDYVKVKVNYGKGRPPRVIIITSKTRTDLGADEVAIVDAADIKKADIMLAPYKYDVNGSQGVSAYLKTAFIFLNEDYLELKYAGLLEGDNQTPTDSIQDLSEYDQAEA